MKTMHTDDFLHNSMMNVCCIRYYR